MTLSPMDGCLRCPSCYLAPEIMMTDPDLSVMIRCQQRNHDHIASGPTLEIALKNWNEYVKGILTQCPELVRNPNETKTEKVINDAMFGIDPKEGNDSCNH